LVSYSDSDLTLVKAAGLFALATFFAKLTFVEGKFFAGAAKPALFSGASIVKLETKAGSVACKEATVSFIFIAH
jgi:hypothetical protein